MSLPFGNDSFTNDNLKFLSLDNVLLDSVAFVDWIRSTVQGTNDSQVIVMGGELLRVSPFCLLISFS